MSRYLRWIHNQFREVIDDFNGCRYAIGDVCCNADCEHCADFICDIDCEECRCFEPELKVDIKHILLREVSFVSFEEHEIDNVFVKLSMFETQMNMEDKCYMPEGVCLSPPFGASSCVAFVYRNESFERRWVHITHRVMICWLRECGFIPPEMRDWEDVLDTVWYSYGPIL